MIKLKDKMQVSNDKDRKLRLTIELVLHVHLIELIHSAHPQSWPVEIIVFAHVVRPSVQNLAKLNKAKTMFATGETVGLAEWFIADTCLFLGFLF